MWDLALVFEPGVEDPQCPVAVVRGGRLPPGEHCAEVALDVLAGGVRELHPVRLQEGGELVDRLQVGLDRAAGLVLGPEVALERAGKVYATRRHHGSSVARGYVLFERCASLVGQAVRRKTAGQSIDFSGM